MRISDWSSDVCSSDLAGPARSEIVLTEAEQVWLAEHPAAAVGMDRAYAPITYLDEQGNPAGIAVDLLRLIEAKSGLKIELAAARWPVVIERALRHPIDAVVNADKTTKRQERLLYNRPYYQVPHAILGREQHAGVAPPAGLATKRVERERTRLNSSH